MHETISQFLRFRYGKGVLMHEFFVAVAPEWEQDFTSQFLCFRKAMPKELRKHLIGPIVSDKGNRSFVFLPCAGSKIEEWRMKFIDQTKESVNVHYAHIRFGDGLTVTSSDNNVKNEQVEKFFQEQMKNLESEWNSRETYLREEIKNLIEHKADAESERDEAIVFRHKDSVLSAAVDELKSLRGKKKIIEAAQKVGEEFKDKTEIPESIKNLLETLK